MMDKFVNSSLMGCFCSRERAWPLIVRFTASWSCVSLCVCVCVYMCLKEKKRGWSDVCRLSMHDWRLYAPEWNILSPCFVTVQLVLIGSSFFFLHNMPFHSWDLALSL